MSCDHQCQTCRFFVAGSCVKYNVSVKNTFEACNDYASNQEITETYNGKIQLND